jgi:hypothetical protein
VVFEKFAEMNNKYDVKNFSDLIDKFKVEDEMKTITEIVKAETESSRVETYASIFDPIIDYKDVT